MASLGTFVRFCAVAGAALALAGCETTGTDTPSSSGSSGFGQSQVTSFGSGGYAITDAGVDPRTGQTVVTGASFVIGSGSGTSAASRPFGTWTLKDTRSGSCSVSFSDSALMGAPDAREVSKVGYCSFEFSDVRGWMTAGRGIALTDASGRIVGQLVAADFNSYSGSLQTNFGPQNVTMTR